MAATVDETLADEQSRRVQAGAAAIAAGILTLAGGGLAAVVYSDVPTVPVLDSLRERFAAAAPEPGVKALQIRWYADNAVELVLVAVVLALAAAAIGVALSHLYRSVKARRPELSPRIVYAAIAGAVLLAVSGIAQAVGLSMEASAFADSADQTSDAAAEVLRAPVVVTGLVLRQFGVFAIGIGFILIALNAMRVGLLTRFMGVLGMIVGALFILPFIIPLGSSLPIVQAFWLTALGALFLGRWPSGLPPAWVTGEAQPWPTQQQLREAKLERQHGGGEAEPERPSRSERRERAEPPETPAPQMPERRPHPSSKKHKRKRR